MKKVVIWGAGQGGKMANKLLHGKVCVIGYCDSNSKMWGQYVGGLPIVSPEQIHALEPDLIFISMLNHDATLSVKNWIAEQGIGADVIAASELKDLFDVRLATLKMISQEIYERNVPGAIAELGVYQGYLAAAMNRLFPERKLYLFDTFSGFDERDIAIEKSEGLSQAMTGNFNDTSINLVRKSLPYPENVIFKQGFFPETVAGVQEKFALVSLDADLYQPLYEGLKFFYPNMSSGGYLLIHDYNNSRFSGAKKAVRQFCEREEVFLVPLPDFHGSAVIVKP